MARTGKFLREIFDLRGGKEQEEKVVDSIKNNIEFRGSRLWDLVFAIAIASIGLNINSVAIIIGAMLISPLMGPIIGLGLSLGTNDPIFFRKSIGNLFFATVIGIAVSTAYFYLTPITNIQSELLSRTSPNIYDILVAFFGGLVGIIGLTRFEKGNVLSGVAIATALMPPLCTVGYGIATGRQDFSLGAFYLYAINCIFICLATLLGVKYLKLPPAIYADKKQSARTGRIFAAVVVAMIIPATYSAFAFIKENNFNQSAEKYVQNTFTQKNYAIIYKNIDYKSNPHKIELAFLSKRFTADEISGFQKELVNYKLSGTEVIIRQDNMALTESQWDDVIANISDEGEKLKAIEAKLAGAASSFTSEETTSRILKEARSINGNIAKIAIGSLSLADIQSSADSGAAGSNTKVVLVYFVPEAKPVPVSEKEVITSWLESRMQDQSIMVYFP